MPIDRRVILFVALCIIVGAIFIGLAQFITRAPANPPAQQTEQQTTQDSQETLEQSTVSDAFPIDDAQIAELSEQSRREFNFAFERAREWRADAVLTAEHIAYTNGIDPVKGKDTFIFSSPSLPTYYWTITLNQEPNLDGTNDYERTIYYKEDYKILERDIVNAPLQYYKTNFIEAIKIADGLGGKAVRMRGVPYDVTATLLNRRGGYLVWHVVYSVNGTTEYETNINSFTGEEDTAALPSAAL